jgi:hypothetical protein
VEIPTPKFTACDAVEPTDPSIRPNLIGGRVESRAWVESLDEPAYWRYTIRLPAGGTLSLPEKHLRRAVPGKGPRPALADSRHYEQTRSARVGEGHFKAQRDSALHLLRWLIGDVIPPLPESDLDRDEGMGS